MNLKKVFCVPKIMFTITPRKRSGFFFLIEEGHFYTQGQSDYVWGPLPITTRFVLQNFFLSDSNWDNYFFVGVSDGVHLWRNGGGA